PAVAVADDIALALLPGGGGALVGGLNDCRALLVAFAARELHALLVDGRGMTERHVIGIKHVFDLELPVARIGIPVHAGIERQFAGGGAVDEVVDASLHRADVVFKARPLRRHAREHEAAVFSHPRGAPQRELLLVETGSAALRYRHGSELAVGVEAPAV